MKQQKGPIKAFPFKTSFEKNRLYLKSESENFGLYGVELKVKAKKIRIHWGVDKFYDKGGDWDNSEKRDPISLTVVFGDKKISSGGFAVPNLPYFVSIFLAKKASNDKAYKGNYYKKGGRYICPNCPITAGEVVITELDFLPFLKKEYGLKEVPKITGLSFGLDARDTSAKGIAFIEKIELLD